MMIILVSLPRRRLLGNADPTDIDEDTPLPIPSLGWDGMNSYVDSPDNLVVGDRPRAMITRLRDPRSNPFPAGFMTATSRGDGTF